MLDQRSSSLDSHAEGEPRLASNNRFPVDDHDFVVGDGVSGINFCWNIGVNEGIGRAALGLTLWLLFTRFCHLEFVSNE